MTIITIPRATARIQFFAGFTMDDAVPIIPYLAKLGISHLYASPLLKARPGSTHCYDIVDHNEINPELGGESALRRLVETLRAHDMGLVLDIVPNHMGVGGADNKWWMDVLEWGKASRYSEFFDIEWEPTDPSLHGKVLAPFLGSSYGAALANGELILQCDEPSGQLFVGYHDNHFPISVRSASQLLREEPAFEEVSEIFANASRQSSRTAAIESALQAKAELAGLLKDTQNKAALAHLLEKFSAKTDDGRRRLHQLLTRQNYRLAWWRAAADEINWRRFFDINTLAGLRVELPRVFDATHAKILALYRQGLIDGVRIDHIDGLADPRLYGRKLRRSMETAAEGRLASAPKGPPYIVVEKILAPRERLPTDWLTNGTTGYDFMDQVGGVLHDAAGEASLTHLWMSLTGRPGEFATEEADARRQVLRDNLASELNANAAALHRIAKRDLFTRDYTLTAIRRALTELLVHFPVYRIYANRAARSEIDAQIMERATAGAHRTFRAADRPLLDIVKSWLVDVLPRNIAPGLQRAERLRAMVRFQQLSAPVAAKSVEDTSFYRYGRLLSRNEVGSNPAIFSITPASFHAANLERQKRLPAAMLATATHDHKRGEDTRARLAVLSEIPDEWETALNRWMRLNAIIRRDLSTGTAPSPADEIMLYQMLVAAWPIGLSADDLAGIEIFSERVAAWQTKSVREAKLLSEWAAPNETYEAALEEFLRGVLDPTRPVLQEIVQFAARLNFPGAINGLAQTILRLTVPGVPDLYQGTEFWDQSLVDPDNRRPVDYAARETALNAESDIPGLLRTWRSGFVKQAIIAKVLNFRKANTDLFETGDYQKLETEGETSQHVLAFTRRIQGKTILVATTRLAAKLCGDMPLAKTESWQDTKLELPAGEMTNILTGDVLTGEDIFVSDLFAKLPIALLASV